MWASGMLSIRQGCKVREKEYLTTEDIARHLDISEATVRRYIRTGKLPAVRLERAYRIRREDFERFLKEREVRAENENAGRSSA